MVFGFIGSALTQFGAAWWAEGRKKVKKAHVYIDAVSCECLHWNGGAESILQAGAACVKEFSTFEICMVLLNVVLVIAGVYQLL